MECYNSLFKRDDDDSPYTISRIIERVFQGKKFSNVELAYVTAICMTMLNPKHDVLQLREGIMKRKVNYYLVGFVLCDIQE